MLELDESGKGEGGVGTVLKGIRKWLIAELGLEILNSHAVNLF